jgi:hypothetical protein
MSKYILLAIFSLGVLHATAQNLSKAGVLKLNVRSSGPIIQDDQVKGYYYFYKVEKQDRRNDNYLLSVYDENLREINTIDITRPKTYVLVDGVFNGEAFGFLFFDRRAKITELITYDRALKHIGNVTREVNNRIMLASYTAIINGAEPSQAYLVPIANKGFLYYGIKGDSKYKYEIQCYNNELKALWSDYADNNTNVAMAAEGFQAGDYVGSMITRKRNLTTRDLEFDLLVHQVSTGEELFRVPMMTDQHTLSFSDVFFDEKEKTFVVFGEYNDKEDKELKTPSRGFMTLTLDMTGNIVNQKLNSWAKEISAAAPVNERGQFDGNNSRILFHDFVRTDDGKIFAIGEQYKKVANAAGIAGNVLLAAVGGSGASFSNTQLNVYNMVIFEFTADYSLRKVYVFEKDKNIVTLPSGSEYVSPKLVSYYAKAYGGFDYAFTQRAPDRSTFHVSYVSYDREKGQASKNVLGSIVYTPEKTFTVDKLPLARRSTSYFVNRAKDGYVLVTEYFKKEKRLDSRLEKINY